MITDTPGVTPVTRPVLLTVATAGVPLLHVPPEVASLNGVVSPTQTVALPVMADGLGFTVTITDVEQPFAV